MVDVLNPHLDLLDGLDQSVKTHLERRQTLKLKKLHSDNGSQKPQSLKSSSYNKKTGGLVSEVSTTFSELSNKQDDAMLKRVRQRQITKTGKQFIP